MNRLSTVSPDWSAAVQLTIGTGTDFDVIRGCVSVLSWRWHRNPAVGRLLFVIGDEVKQVQERGAGYGESRS